MLQGTRHGPIGRSWEGLETPERQNRDQLDSRVEGCRYFTPGPHPFLPHLRAYLTLIPYLLSLRLQQSEQPGETLRVLEHTQQHFREAAL